MVIGTYLEIGICDLEFMQDHIPVLLDEVLKYVNPGSNQNFIDATVGLAGHSFVILAKNGPVGKVLGIEADAELYAELVAQKLSRLILVNDSYMNLKKIVASNEFGPVHGIIADLGMSSWHLDQSGRGFSFLKDEPLDMRYSQGEFKNQNLSLRNISRRETKTKICPYGTYLEESQNLKFSEVKNNTTAAEIINSWSEESLSDIFHKYGEERFSRQIAKKIVVSRKVRPIISTFQLVDIVEAATPVWYHRQKIHQATRVFQALRIAVNDELENLKTFLPQAIEVLQEGGRLAVISFHSLEDRIVKNFFREQKQGDEIKILTKKPITADRDEIKNNPRSRSAKLRVAIKL